MADKKDLEQAVLQFLSQKGCIEDSMKFLESQKMSPSEHDALVGVLKSLQVLLMVDMKAVNNTVTLLTKEGEEALENGSPEARVFAALPDNGATMPEMNELVGKDVAKVGWSKCIQNKWVKLQGDKKSKAIAKQVAEIKDNVQIQLKSLKLGETLDKKVATDLKKRKLTTTKSFKTWKVTKGAQFSLERKTLATDLTSNMLKTAEWESEEFKEYNFEARSKALSTGALHPLMKVRHQFRGILLEMGFEEMPTNNFVENSFWNFDALFQPQQHPARDAHDTFFIKQPSDTDPNKLPQDYLERVRNTHQTGGYGSIGYRMHWQIAETTKNILRTHTTAVSSRMLYKLAQQEKFEPVRYFSIDRVFRNESLDATHLAEFHQVEGLVADYDLTLGDLIGTIKSFFSRIGIEDVQFKPAFNPYTEPSMEIFGYSKQMERWMEIGNSGMFRPEMLRPMGLPENVNVIAWGLSLERPTMIKYGLKNIRDLFGPKVDLNIISQNPIARFD